MRRIATRALLVALVGLILSTLLLAGVPAVALSTYQSKILDTFGPDIIAYWPLNEMSGTVAYDVSGNHFNGTYYGVTPAQSAGAGSTFGLAPSFDGVNDYIELYSAGLATEIGTGDLTMCVWLKAQSAAGLHYAFLLGNFSADPNFFMGMSRNNETLTFAIGPGIIVGSISIPDDTWELACLTTESSLSISYIGSEAKGSGTRSTWSTTINTALLGKYLTFFWRGNIAHVLIIKRAFTPEEIGILADTEPIPDPTPTPTPPPISHYMTLASAQPVRLDYSATAGDMLISTLMFIVLGLGAFLLFLTLRSK
jgi:hypothetical protein